MEGTDIHIIQDIHFIIPIIHGMIIHIMTIHHGILRGIHRIGGIRTYFSIQ